MTTTVSVSIDVPSLAAKLANGLFQRKACGLKRLQVTADRLFAHAQFLDHILDRHAIVAGAERPQENPLTHQRQLVAHRNIHSIEVTSGQNVSIINRYSS